MSNLNTVKSKDLGADGRLRRKYELDDEIDEPGKGRMFARGLVIANVMFAFKQIMAFLWKDDASAKDPALAAKENQQLAEEENSSQVDDILKNDKNKQSETPSNEISSDLEFGGTNRQFENPNYSALLNLSEVTDTADGSNVVPFPVKSTPFRMENDSISFTSSGLGAGGSSGPVAAESDEGDTQQNNSDDDEDDDSTPVRVNRAPVIAAPVVLGSIYVNQSVAIAMTDLLAGTHDPDGDPLHVTNVTASSGTIRQTAADKWLFTPERFDISDVEFAFQINDGEAAVGQYASLDIAPIPGEDIDGTDGADRIVGTAGNDRIDGRAGDDDIVAREGDDIIYGGDGDDRIVGGDGDDVIYANAGNDIVFAGAGNDTVFGGDGEDFLAGEEGNDVLFGGLGNDHLTGGDGDDRVFGGRDDDNLRGNSGDDLLDAGAGDDDLFGGDGNDIIVAGLGDDTADGGGGDDQFIARLDDGNDIYIGGAGVDALDFSSVSAGISVNLQDGTTVSVATGTDQVSGIENIIAGSGSDTVVGDSANNVIEGGAGSDTLDGGSGADIFIVSDDDGDDTIEGGTGADTLDFSAVSVGVNVNLQTGTSVSVTSGLDTISNVENVTGTRAADEIIGDAENNEIVGGEGDDDLSGKDGADIFVASLSDGDDAIDGGEGLDTVDLSISTGSVNIDLGLGVSQSEETGTDQLQSIEIAVTGSGDDTVVGTAGANIITTNDGDDHITAGGGADTVHGGGGNDVFISILNDGDDIYDGGDGDDTLDLSITVGSVQIDLDIGQSSSSECGVDQIINIETIISGAGDDIITGDDSDNRLRSNHGDDIVYAAGGDDEIRTGHGNDIIVAGAGDDEAEGGHDDDIFIATMNDGDDDYDGDHGNDTYDVSGTSHGATINLSIGTAFSDDIGNDTLDDFENVIGSTGDDIIVANDEANILVGNAGNDVFVFIEANGNSGSGRGGHHRDRIEDFETGDRIDFSDLDGSWDDDGFQRITFQYDQASFTGVGQVLAAYENGEDGDMTVLRFNFEYDNDGDDDDDAEFEIEFVGYHQFGDHNLVV